MKIKLKITSYGYKNKFKSPMFDYFRAKMGKPHYT